MVALIDVLLPPACAGCGGYGSLLCGTCRDALDPPADDEDAFLAPDAGTVLGQHFVLAIAAFSHRGVAQRALRRLKYGDARRASGPLARAALPAFRRLSAVSGPAALVPVPLHPERLRLRGYNQAALLAAELARCSGARVWPGLRRARPTERQHGLDRAARLRNLSGAFRVEQRWMAASRNPPDTAILVDDILTTSATMEACAAVLAGAGIGSVYGFAIAREV